VKDWVKDLETRNYSDWLRKREINSQKRRVNMMGFQKVILKRMETNLEIGLEIPKH